MVSTDLEGKSDTEPIANIQYLLRVGGCRHDSENQPFVSMLRSYDRNLGAFF